MNIKGILRPEELPFECPDMLASDINALLDAMERDDFLNLDCYMNEVQSSAREIDEENDAWICNYYLYGGYKEDLKEEA